MKGRLYSKTDLRRFLSTLDASTDDFLTIYIAPSSFPDYLNQLTVGDKYEAWVAEIKKAAGTKEVVESVAKYNTGAVIFWSPTNKHMVLPAFSIPANKMQKGVLDASVLRDTIEGKYLIGVVMVTWGWYALGMFDGDSLIECKTGTGYIHKEHKKGGRSQKRFARRTEEQKKDFLRRVGNRIEERFGSYLPDYIFFGGNRLILKPLIKESTYLQTRTDKISPRVLNVRHADREALGGSLTEINRSLVYTF